MVTDFPLAPTPRNVAGLVLASGHSNRFGVTNKLTTPFGEMPLVRRTLLAYLEAGLSPVLLIVGHQAKEVIAAVQDLHVDVVCNPDYGLGQSRALVRGVQALPAAVSAVAIGVGDQPFLTASIICRLVAEYRRSGAPLVVPRYRGRRGNPVLFDQRHFPALQLVEGDQGGRGLLTQYANDIAWVDFDDVRPAIDIDTEDDYLRALSLRNATE